MFSQFSLFIESGHWLVLLAVLGASLLVLSKSADALVEQAVLVSKYWGIPNVITGATIVSIGTTLPEVVVSVMAAIQGRPGIALGNAVGSIICDTGLILGLAALIGVVPLPREVVKRQGWIQLSVVCLLVLVCLPFYDLASTFTEGGSLSRFGGFGLVGLLVLYLVMQVRWAKESGNSSESNSDKTYNFVFGGFVLVASFIGLALASEGLIVSASELARRMTVPESVIAVTIVAFGTSLPELITAISAVRKGHGGIALGNVIGADILNVLLVAGMAAAINPTGLEVGPEFFRRAFPIMLIIVGTCRIGLSFSKRQLEKKYAYALLSLYVISSIVNGLSL